MTLPTGVFGPDLQGRGYRLLADSGIVPGSWSADLPMVLLEWAKREDAEPFVACFPAEDGSALVCRARFFRRLPIGPVAFLHVAQVFPAAVAALEYRTEIIAAAMPTPDETLAFAAAPMAIPGSIPACPAIRDLGLAWADCLITAEPPNDLETVAMRALSSIDPPDLRERVRGWATTAGLVTRGALAPLRQCQLIVTRLPPDQPLPHHRFVLHADGMLEGQAAPAPAQRGLWRTVLTMVRDHGGATSDLLAALRWLPRFATDPPAAVCAWMARTATGFLNAEAMIGLLVDMTRQDDPAIRAGGDEVLREYLAALPDRGVGAIAPQLLPAIAGDDHALTGLMLAHLRTAEIDRLALADLLLILDAGSAVLGDPATAGNPAALGGLAMVLRHYLLRAVEDNGALDPVARVVADWPGQAIGLLGWMVSPAVVTALAAAGRDVLATVSAGVLRPLPDALAAAGGRAAFARILRAHLSAMRALEPRRA